MLSYSKVNLVQQENENPYAAPSAAVPIVSLIEPRNLRRGLFTTFLASCICLYATIEKSPSSNDSIFGIGYGFIPIEGWIGTTGFIWAIPLLAIMPTVVAGFFLRRLSLTSISQRSFRVAYITLGIVTAVLFSCMIRGAGS